MWLILCAAADRPALWAYRGLMTLGASPVELVTADMLACATAWEHRIDETGGPSSRLRLADGRVIDSVEVRGTLNRLTFIPDLRTRRAAPIERTYAEQELHALRLSWLLSLPGPMLNRPVAPALTGPDLHPSAWIHLAGRAGLPVTSWSQSDAAPGLAERAAVFEVVVLDNQVFGQGLPAGLVEGCRCLGEAAGARLFGAHFALSGGQARFAGATHLPDLSAGGHPLLAALAAALGVAAEVSA